MAAYDRNEPGEQNLELGQALLERCQPLEQNSPEWSYLTGRGLPASAIHYAAADLRSIPPPIPGLDQLARGIVSFLRDQDRELSGLAIEAVGVAGQRLTDSAGRTVRRTYCLKPGGVGAGVFRIDPPGGGGMLCYATESFLVKPIALVAALGAPAVVGVGSRKSFGRLLPPEPSIAMIEDARPEDEQEAAAHDQDLERGADRYLLGGRAVLRLPGPPCGCCGDIDQALIVHGSEVVAGWLRTLEPAKLSLDGESRRCARITDPLKRGQAIAEAVERHGLKRQGLTGFFRQQVEAYRGPRGNTKEDEEAGGEEGAGSSMVFEEVLPAVDPVDGVEVLDEIDAALERHAHCPETDRALATLWLIHGYRRFAGNVGVLPRLIITAGREDAGKTHLAMALAHMTEKAEHTISPRPANVYRAIEAHQCAFFLDEVDVWYPRSIDMQDIINSGFNRSGASVLRVEDTGTGGRRQMESRRFSTFTPIALIGNDLEAVLPRTVLTRSLILKMRPARVGSEVEDLYDNPPAVARLRATARRIKRWALDNERALSAASPTLPPGTINRLRLVWRPLLAIAELAGGEWPKRALAALEVARARGADPGLGLQLLVDVHAILEMHAAAAGGMHTSTILEHLLQMELRTWGCFGRARAPMRDTDVARLLNPFEVRPKQIKIVNRNRRGYLLVEVAEAVATYVPSSFSDGPANPRYARYPATPPPEASNSAGSNGSTPAEDGSGVAGADETENEVAATEDAGATTFPEQSQSGSGVAAPEGVPEERKGANGAYPAASTCSGPECANLLPPTVGRGRPAKYCSSKCRQRAHAAKIKGADVTPRVEGLDG